ncbi:MAG: ABC transporter ATP-binding protein [Deltaproteobacteria bacterium]|nr:ABC transporter ATP-binding protein [Deltaproteobacteria bacterium]MBW2359501.1 ABC transporter ATP-binding protein [Deltaproteobacteria bacterium]
MHMFIDIARGCPRRTALMVVFLLVGVGAEAVGLSALLPLLSLLVGEDASGGGQSRLQEVVVESLAWFGVASTLGNLLSFFVLAAIVQSGVMLLAKRYIGFTAVKMATDLRLALLGALAEARWGYFSRQTIGAVSSAMASEAGRASQAYVAGGTMISLALQATVYSVLAFVVSWRFSLVALGAAMVSFYPVRFFNRLTRKAGRKQTQFMRSLVRQLTQSLQAVKPLKAMSREARLGALLERDAKHLDRALRKHVLASEGRKAVQYPLNALFASLAIYAAATYGDVPLAELGVLAVLLTSTFSNASKAQRQYQAMCAGESAYWDLRDRIERAEGECEETSGSCAPVFEHSIEFADVVFGYGDTRVLKGVSFAIPAGCITALIGTSGAGKTSLVDLVCALNRPDAGSITVDGVPLHELDLVGWRRSIGYVPQDMFLLHESVRLNVTLGEEFSDVDVETALRRAGAWGFVSQLAEGIETVVGEGGSRLSGGQRQRISIARALVHDPQLLILDEATSGLDPETEATVWNSLLRLRGDITILAISHQPLLMSVADHVYRVEAGEVSPDDIAAVPAAVARPV